MAEKKVNPLVQHVINNTEKALALIKIHTGNGEEALYLVITFP